MTNPRVNPVEGAENEKLPSIFELRPRRGDFSNDGTYLAHVLTYSDRLEDELRALKYAGRLGFCIPSVYAHSTEAGPHIRTATCVGWEPIRG